VEAHYGNIWAENIYSITKHKTGARLIIALPKAKALKKADIDASRENLES
jgi:hypothetical protein